MKAVVMIVISIIGNYMYPCIDRIIIYEVHISKAVFQHIIRF